MKNELNKILKNLGNVYLQVKSLHDGLVDGSVDKMVDDKYYALACKTVIKGRRVSTSYLQRKLGIGYAKSANLIDMLEKNGVVSSSNNSGLRKVLVKKINN